MVLAFHGVVLIQPAGPTSNCRDYTKLTAKGWENTIAVTTGLRPPASTLTATRSWLPYSRVQCGLTLPNSRPWSAREAAAVIQATAICYQSHVLSSVSGAAHNASLEILSSIMELIMPGCAEYDHDWVVCLASRCGHQAAAPPVQGPAVPAAKRGSWDSRVSLDLSQPKHCN